MSKPAKKQAAASRRSLVARKKGSEQQIKDQKSPLLRAPSKQARVIELLWSSKGTTIEAMMKATGWQQHSVRGFLAGVVRKRLKLKLSSELSDGIRVYRLSPPIEAGSHKPQTKQR